ncbi:hypothetical protein JXM83_01775 [Candidatus Woesearchaeota archaeon]|nr:hypothetical protein [Candidatus Woesearchaeota archaeon]
MGLFGNDFGRLGKLSSQEWKKLLMSNSGLFKHRHDVPKGILGPTYSSDSNSVIGDMLSMENFIFSSVASTEQVEFYGELLSINSMAATEYMLTVSGAIIAWKKDMIDLQNLYHSLQKSEKLFDAEEHLLIAEKKLIEEEEEFIKVKTNSVAVLDTLKRHLPDMVDVIKDLDLQKIIEKDSQYLDEIGVERLIRIINSVESQIRSRESFLKAYIEKMKSKMPFLFE